MACKTKVVIGMELSTLSTLHSEVPSINSEIAEFDEVLDDDDNPLLVNEASSPAAAPVPVGRERKWVVTLFVGAAAFCSVLAGCSLGFPSSALLDLQDAEQRPEFKFNNQLSELFGVSPSASGDCEFSVTCVPNH